MTVRPSHRRDVEGLRPPLSLYDTGVGRLRIGPHRGDGTLVAIGPLPGSPLSSPAAVHQALEHLRSEGWRRAVTPALSPIEQEPYFANGFTIREHLHLLERPVRLGDARTRHRAPGLRLSRATHADRPAVLAVDHRAFDDFWRLDERGLLDAVAATPAARFRVLRDGSEVVGYAITGRAGRRGYLQRLAVAPEHRRRGLAGVLLGDGLRWLARSGCRAVLVNTQERNTGALALYERWGFRRQPAGLAVLEADLTRTEGAPPAAVGP